MRDRRRWRVINPRCCAREKGDLGDQSEAVIDRVKVREVSGVFRTRKALDAAANDLLTAGFDRADIDLMVSVDTVRGKLRRIYRKLKQPSDPHSAPRRAYVAREDVVVPLSMVAG